LEYSILDLHPIGIMQGRLSQQTSKGYQAFPETTWRQEFELAKGMGLSHIEWVIDSPSPEMNPLIVSPQTVKSLAMDTVPVRSVCADFVMQDFTGEWRKTSELLKGLLQGMQIIGATHIVAPFVDATSIRNGLVSRLDFERFIEEWIEISQGSGILMAVESDLEPDSFTSLLGPYFDHKVGINYDIGNSAALGYSWEEEMSSYFDRVNLLHIKDRVLMGNSVMLGTGEASLAPILNYFFSKNWDGIITLQAFRDHEGVAVLQEQLDWLSDHFPAEHTE